MHRGSLQGLVLLSVGLAGCVAAPEPAALDPTSLAGEPLLGLASGLPLERASTASIEMPPQWALGEWWRYKVENLAFGHTLEVVRVVAGAEPGRYLVGMPAEDFNDEIMVMHFPGFGQVDRATLGFEAHDLMFEPVRFPLRAGATWTTHWYNGDPMEARVAAVGEGTVEVELEHPLRRTTLTYDAALGEVREMRIENYLRYEVLEHGFGYAGRVVVPYAHDLVVCHGRLQGVQAIDGCGLDSSPRAPVETIRLMGRYDRLSFALVLRPRPPAPAPVGPGYFEIQVTAPDGTVYAAATSPTEPGPVLAAHGHDQPMGNWQMRAIAGGPGDVIFEGPAYRVLEAALGA